MDSEALSTLYKLRFPEHQLQRKNAIWRVLCQVFLQRFVQATDTVVDVACGHGEFLNHIAAARKLALDLNPQARRFLGPEVAFHGRRATELFDAVGCCADVVFTSNFLEHLPDKPTLDLFLQQVWKTLKPGGRFLVLGPNLRYLPGAYWDFYDHHLGLTHGSLCEALQLQGFGIQTCIARFLPYTTQGALPTHPALVWLYLHLPWAWRILGKQFFVVAHKPLPAAAAGPA